MSHQATVRGWISRPARASQQWPADELRAAGPVPVALRVRDARNVVGVLRLITPTALMIDDGDRRELVPFEAVRAYALVERRRATG